MPIRTGPPAKRVLAVDVGNTRTHAAFFDRRGRVSDERSFPTGSPRSLFRIIRPDRAGNFEALISSVVPGAISPIRDLLSPYAVRVRVLGSQLAVPIKNHAARPCQVGADRLLNALAAYRRFRRPCVAVDFGTAVTFDRVGRGGAYRGGAIFPGIEMALDALHEKTALLPRVRFKPAERVVGRDTSECILSGVCHGLGALCDGILERMDREARVRHAVIGTGGSAAAMSLFSRRLKSVDPLLTLRGIWVSWLQGF